MEKAKNVQKMFSENVVNATIINPEIHRQEGALPKRVS